MKQKLSSTEIVERYLTFFKSRGHTELPGSSLVVPGYSTSFVIAGMQPLLPYLRGQQPPPSPRLTSLQRCLRSDDADSVGTNNRRNTSFHMLGNWSIGNYSKSEAIEWALELLVNNFGLDQERLWITTFGGDTRLGIAPDEVTVKEWQHAGISIERIVPLGSDDNFWTMNGPGPCGPNSEIYVDCGIEMGCNQSTCRPGCSCARFLEIWNLVFMEYELLADASIELLPLRNIDTGMGLERMAVVLQEVDSVFSIDLFQPANQFLAQLAPEGGDGLLEVRARRMIVDHARAALLALLAGVEPGRDGRNSVVRRLLRRAARQGRLLDIEEPFLYKLLEPLALGHSSLLSSQEHQRIPEFVRVVTHEEAMFERVLTTGLHYLSRVEPDKYGIVRGDLLFKLHAEKGFPADLAAEVLEDRGFSVDWSSYETAEQEHQRVSRLSLEKHFGKA